MARALFWLPVKPYEVVEDYQSCSLLQFMFVSDCCGRNDYFLNF